MDSVSIDMDFFLRKYRPHEFEYDVALPEMQFDYIPTDQEKAEMFEREKKRNMNAGERGDRRVCAICCQGGMLGQEEGSVMENASCWGEGEQGLVKCRDCGVYVHRECYGVGEEVTTSTGWQCDRCKTTTAQTGKPQLVKCLLCPNLGGAFKVVQKLPGSPAHEDQWVHVQCALWTPEVDFGQPANLSEVTGLEMIGRDRWDLTCSVCRKRQIKHKQNGPIRGACIQCCKSTCATAFHVTCAQQNGLFIRQTSPLECAENFCGAHDPCKHSTAGDGITEGAEVCWGARGFMEGQVRSLKEERMHKVLMLDDNSVMTVPEAAVRPNEAKVSEEQDNVLVKWPDGKDYEAVKENTFTLTNAVLEDASGRYVGTLPACTLINKGQKGYKSKKIKVTAAAPRVPKQPTSRKVASNLMTPKTKNWTILLKSYADQAVFCKKLQGTLVWHEDRQLTEVDYIFNGAPKVLALA